MYLVGKKPTYRIVGGSVSKVSTEILLLLSRSLVTRMRTMLLEQSARHKLIERSSVTVRDYAEFVDDETRKAQCEC
jgi:hypothetical protein